MVRAKGKAHKGGAALSKAIRTGQTKAGGATGAGVDRLATTCLDFRTAAAVSEFTLEDRGLDVAKRASTKDGVKTVFAGESRINVDHRIRVAATPLGAPLDDDAYIAEALSIEGFLAIPPNLARRLMPRRPAWTFELSSGRLHHREAQAFKQWLEELRQMFADRGGYPPAFEQNLQVWRQLWRVLERCDVAVLVIDARHPLLHLPPALVFHVTRTLRKPLILVLNKLDAVEPAHAERWAQVLQRALPSVAGVVGYSKESLHPDAFDSLPVGREALIAECHRASLAAKEAVARGERRAPAASPEAPAICSDGAGGRASGAEAAEAAAAVSSPDCAVSGQGVAAGRLLLGLVGHPNVGKSSLVNSIMGGKVVSVKATPGHTKTLQTLILDERTCLCDSPGVVFPRLEVPREAQIVGMLIPLAQVREPFSALRWVMEHATKPLNEVLNLRPATLEQVMELRENGTDALDLKKANFDEGGPVPWSPMLLCAQYAQQRGLVRTRGPDCIKAGIEIVEKVLDGRVPYAVPPPTEFGASGGSGAGLAGARPEGKEEEGSDADSDWQVDDGDYESEEENPELLEKLNNGDLVGFFGEERLGPGSRSIASRKKQAKMEKKIEIAKIEESM